MRIRSSPRPRLQIAERVDGVPVHAYLEVQVRPEAVPGAADVADHLSLRHGLPVRDGDARLVGVAGRDAATVVDEDEVSVPAHPAGVDDAPGRSGVDRRSFADGDVDPGVHPAPSDAEAADDRTAHGPDEAA